MHTSELVYAIPPYLLNTALGANLHRRLNALDPKLAHSNVAIVGSSNYNVSPPQKSTSFLFSRDPELNEAIKEKMIYKLGILGIAGTDYPMSKLSDDDYLMEVYEIFKHRLLADSDDFDDNERSKRAKSKLFTGNAGEVSLGNSKYSNYSLKQLLNKAKAEESLQTQSVSSFIQVNGETFQYLLPVTWVPLISSDQQKFLTNNLGMDITIDKGYSCINFSCSGDVSLPKKYNKYTNFITDKPVTPSSGVFYYEVELEQKSTSATSFKPLIVTNEESISSINSMHVCVGFTKRFSNIEMGSRNYRSNPVPSNKILIDFEEIKNDVNTFVYGANNERKPNDTDNISTESSMADDYLNFLQQQPGILSSSFAVNFEDSHFHNSDKKSESLQRAAVLNMNRRMSNMDPRLSLSRSTFEDAESGKVDLGIPLTTYLEKNTISKKEDSYRTDIIGCGINFYDKSMFYTMNGVLVKNIPKEEFSSTISCGDSLFFDAETELSQAIDKCKKLKQNSEISVADFKSVYPIIGIQLENEIKGDISEPSTAKITTNLGFKEFKFNIKNYIQKFHQDLENELSSSFAEKNDNPESLDKSSFEYKLLNVEDSGMMNQLIKEYLNHEAYVESFKGFESDLNKLQNEISPSESTKGEETQTRSNQEILKQSNTENRKILKQFITNSNFDLALEFLAEKFSWLLNQENEKITYQLKLMKYIYLIKEYYNYSTSKDLFKQILEFNQEMQNDFSHNKEYLAEIRLVSSLSLQDKSSYKSLPRASEYIINYDKNLANLADDINKKILELLGFGNSTLESILNRIEENIETLSLKCCDDKFTLINFERDYVDL